MDRRDFDRTPAALDEVGHGSLTAAILARTSGNPCVAAHDRLCDFIDNALPAFDRGLVQAHLDHCEACSALAGALARSAAVLPAFAETAPPVSLVAHVLAATSRRATEPGFSERVAAWLARAAMRPRFSLSVAYVATLLIVVLVGDPVSAFRRTVERSAVYVQPAIAAVGEQVAARVNTARQLGAETIGAVASLAQRPDTASKGWDGGMSAVRQWLVANLGAPLASVIERVSQWIQATMDAVVQLIRPEPAKQGRTEPYRQPVRLS